MNNRLAPLAAGLAGSTGLTLLHEALRQVRADAPRADRVGGRAVSAVYRLAGARPPRGRQLYRVSLIGDLVTNAAYYGGVMMLARRRPLLAGGAAGLAAGLGMLWLAPRLGLGRATRFGVRRRERSALMTVGLYLAGGLIAASARRWMSRRR